MPFASSNGISRGYSLAEILGEKWIEGGVLQWKGIRGGTREAVYQGESTFALEAGPLPPSSEKYAIEVEVPANGKPPRVVGESLSGSSSVNFDSKPLWTPWKADSGRRVAAVSFPGGYRVSHDPDLVVPGVGTQYVSTHPALFEIYYNETDASGAVRPASPNVMGLLSSMRSSSSLRTQCAFPPCLGRTCSRPRGETSRRCFRQSASPEPSKAAILEWLGELTPLDVVDFRIRARPDG